VFTIFDYECKHQFLYSNILQYPVLREPLKIFHLYYSCSKPTQSNTSSSLLSIQSFCNDFHYTQALAYKAECPGCEIAALRFKPLFLTESQKLQPLSKFATQLHLRKSDKMADF